MNVPPLVARVSIRRRGRSRAVWVPIVLLWLPLAVLLLPVLLVLLLATFVAAPRWRFHRLGAGLYTAVCELRGAHVEVEDARGGISIAFH